MSGPPRNHCPRPRHILRAAAATALALAMADALFSDIVLNAGRTSPLFLVGMMSAAGGGFLAVLAAVGLGVYAARGMRSTTVVQGALSRTAFVLAGLVMLAALGQLAACIYTTGEVVSARLPIVLVALLPLVATRFVTALLPGGARAVSRRRWLLVPPILATVVAVPTLLAHGGEAGLVWQVGPWLGLLVVLVATVRALLRRPRVATALAGSCGVWGVIALVGLPGAMRWGPGKASAADAEAGRASGGAVKRVILLTVDTLRRDALDVYSTSAPPTPALGQLAGDSIVFDTAISPAPWTLPAFASIHTGLLPDVHMATRFDRALPAVVPTLAECMRDAGYRTAAFGYNPFLTPAYKLDRGFEQYNMFPRAASGAVGVQILRQVTPDLLGENFDAADITRLSVRWLERHRGEPFFLWVHYFDPHLPYAPPHEYLPPGPPPARIGTSFAADMLTSVRSGHFVPTAEEVAWLRGLYDGEVRYVDENVGRLIEALKRMDLYDGTLIVFASDHGEEFWDHGGYEHGHTVYDELIRVPLMIKLPGQTVHERIAPAVCTASIMPTVLDLCGVRGAPEKLSVRSLVDAWDATAQGGEAYDDAWLDGGGDFGEQDGTAGGRGDLTLDEDEQTHAMSGYTAGGDGSGDGGTDGFAGEPIVSTGCAYYENKIAIRFGRWKFIESELSGQEWLFDIDADPGERRPIGAGRTAEFARPAASAAGIVSPAVSDAGLANPAAATGADWAWRTAHELLARHRKAAAALRAQLAGTQRQHADLGESQLRELRSLGYVQ